MGLLGLYKQNQMSAQKKQSIKIKQFQWYEVETKVREIMVDLLQPFNKKQMQESIKINEIKRNLTAMQKKIEDHDFLLERQNATKPTYIQLQDKKIQQIQTITNNSQLQNQGKIKKMEAVIQIYEDKIKQLNDLQSRLDKEILQRAQDFKQYKEGLDKQLQLMTNKQHSMTQEMNQFKNMTKSSINKMESKMIAFQNRLRELEDDSKHKGSDIRKLIQDVSLNNQKIIKLELKSVNLNARVEDRQRDSKLSQKFLTKVKQVENDLMFLTTFLQQYQPLYTQMHISDALNSFIDGKQRRKLCIFQQQRFARLHHHILMNQKISLQEMMSDFTIGIRKIINRNKKYIINLAVTESVKYGANVYQFRIDDEPHEKQDQPQRKQSTNIIFPEEEISRVVAEKIGTMSEEIKQIMEEEIKPTKSWIKQLQEQLLMRSLEYDSKYQELKKHIFQNQTKFQLQQKHVQLTLNEQRHKQVQIDSSVTYFRDYVKDILNFSSVVNHIVIQDQIDRQGTALYALKSSKNSEHTQMPTLQLDQNCVSCDNKNAPLIQQAFKMACLTYNPSQIRIDDQLFSREEILEISTGILEKLKKKLWANQNSKINNQTVLLSNQTIDRDRDLSKKSAIQDNRTSRKSSSGFKDGSIASRESARSRQMQTLLPILGASSRPDRRDKKGQLSVFY